MLYFRRPPAPSLCCRSSDCCIDVRFLKLLDLPSGQQIPHARCNSDEQDGQYATIFGRQRRGEGRRKVEAAYECEVGAAGHDEWWWWHLMVGVKVWCFFEPCGGLVGDADRLCCGNFASRWVAMFWKLVLAGSVWYGGVFFDVLVVLRCRSRSRRVKGACTELRRVELMTMILMRNIEGWSLHFVSSLARLGMCWVCVGCGQGCKVFAWFRLINW